MSCKQERHSDGQCKRRTRGLFAGIAGRSASMVIRSPVRDVTAGWVSHKQTCCRGDRRGPMSNSAWSCRACHGASDAPATAGACIVLDAVGRNVGLPLFALRVRFLCYPAVLETPLAPYCRTCTLSIVI